MKEEKTIEVSSGPLSNGPIPPIQPDTLQPLSDDPKDRGLYIVTTYTDFVERYTKNGKSANAANDPKK